MDDRNIRYGDLWRIAKIDTGPFVMFNFNIANDYIGVAIYHNTRPACGNDSEVLHNLTITTYSHRARISELA